MTDLELTRLVADAMDIKPDASLVKSVNYDYALAYSGYNPLQNDAQAMALVKKFRLTIELSYDGWWVCTPEQKISSEVMIDDLNRAICECVAKMRSEKDK